MPQPHRFTPIVPGLSRRQLLRRAIWGSGGLALALTGHAHVAQAAGGTDALLLSCMDYRLTDDIERYMAGQGFREKYDHLSLAGAALGAVTEKYPAWNTTFWEHLEIALKLHNIHTVILMDHRDCGAYKVILGAEHTKDRDSETAAHRLHLHTLKGQILAKHPTLTVATLLMALDGSVETLS